MASEFNNYQEAIFPWVLSPGFLMGVFSSLVRSWQDFQLQLIVSAVFHLRLLFLCWIGLGHLDLDNESICYYLRWQVSAIANKGDN